MMKELGYRQKNHFNIIKIITIRGCSQMISARRGGKGFHHILILGVFFGQSSLFPSGKKGEQLFRLM